MRTPKAAKAAAVLFGASLVAAACGSSNNNSSSNTSAAATTAAPATTTAATTATTAPSTATSAAGGGTGGMTITIKLNPKAVWDDGTPIGVKDFQCTLDAVMNTPGSLSTTGYDQITSVEQGADAQTVVLKLKTVYAPYKNLFGNPGLLEASKFKNCKDTSADMQDNIPFSAREYKIQSW